LLAVLTNLSINELQQTRPWVAAQGGSQFTRLTKGFKPYQALKRDKALRAFPLSWALYVLRNNPDEISTIYNS